MSERQMDEEMHGVGSWVVVSPALEMRQVGDPGLYEVELRRRDGDEWVTWRASLRGSTWRLSDEVAELRFIRVER